MSCSKSIIYSGWHHPFTETHSQSTPKMTTVFQKRLSTDERRGCRCRVRCRTSSGICNSGSWRRICDCRCWCCVRDSWRWCCVRDSWRRCCVRDRWRRCCVRDRWRRCCVRDCGRSCRIRHSGGSIRQRRRRLRVLYGLASVGLVHRRGLLIYDLLRWLEGRFLRRLERSLLRLLEGPFLLWLAQHLLRLLEGSL